MSGKQITIMLISGAVNLGCIVANVAFHVPRSLEPWCLFLLMASSAVLLILLVFYKLRKKSN
jgi:hypothetical protein